MSESSQSRVILWGVPRSVSTSFLKCMTSVEDSIVWHEPYLYANMTGTDGTNTAYFKSKMEEMMAQMAAAGSLPPQPGPDVVYGDNIYEAAKHDFAWVRERMEEDQPGKKLIFNKDMVQGIDGHYDALPKGYRHTFLIRHPLKVFASFKRMVAAGGFTKDRLPELTPYIIPSGYFFKEMYDLVEHVKKEYEPNPVIIDADDLLSNTSGVMKSYCDAMGIAYSESLLSWPAGEEAMMKRWCSPKELLEGGKMAHVETFKSTGFGNPTPLPDRSELSEDVLELADASMSYYEKLYEQRLKC